MYIHIPPTPSSFLSPVFFFAKTFFPLCFLLYKGFLVCLVRTLFLKMA